MASNTKSSVHDWLYCTHEVPSRAIADKVMDLPRRRFLLYWGGSCAWKKSFERGPEALSPDGMMPISMRGGQPMVQQAYPLPS